MNSLFSVFVHFTHITCHMVERILLKNSLNAPNRPEMLHNEWKVMIFSSSGDLCSSGTHILLMDLAITSRISDFGSPCGVYKLWHFRSP